MKRWLIILFISFMSMIVASIAYGNTEPEAGVDYIDNKMIVTTIPEIPDLAIDRTDKGIAITGVASIDNLCRRYQISKVEPFYRSEIKNTILRSYVSRMYIFTLDKKELLFDCIRAFESNRSVEYAELYIIPHPFYTPNDSLFGEQWYLPHIDAPQAWDYIRGDTTRHSIIGIIDTGVYWMHPDILPNIWVNEPEDLNGNGMLDDDDLNGIDDDGNGYIDDVVGWDCGNNDNDPREDSPTHGTHVAGCASAATDNNIGIASIGFSTRLMCVKGADHSGNLTQVYQGMIWAANNGADIINCSWGSSYYSHNYQQIIRGIYHMGAIIVAAAGGDTSYPGGYDYVLSVGAVDENDVITNYSCRWADLYAPGENILSTWSTGSYTHLFGTSMAGPIVSGLAGLVWAKYPDLKNSDIESIILESADNIDSLNPGHFHVLRRINAGRCFMTTSIDDYQNPNRIALLRAYPNPFNSKTTIEFTMTVPGDVELTIYDITGAKVTTIKGRGLEPGRHSIVWEAKDAASGVYFARLDVAGKSESAKMLLLK